MPEDKLASSVGASRVRSPPARRWSRSQIPWPKARSFDTVTTVITVRRGMVSKPKGKQVPISGYYDPDTVRRLLRLSEVTRVPQAVYLREALEDLLGKYASILRKAK